MIWPITFSCACGDSWRLTVPMKFRTRDFYEYAMTEWLKAHDGHLIASRRAKKDRK